MSQNPFKYGELSSGDNFCNRKVELKRLHNAFRDGQSVIFISPRRWGKSSLVDRAIDTYNGKCIVVKVDCFGIRSSEDFYATLLKAVLLATGSKAQQVAETIKQHIKSIIPYINYSIGEDDEVRISLNLPQAKLDVGAILNLPQSIFSKRGIRIVICIDEFQQMAEFIDGKSTLETLRKYWQRHSGVCYCLYGSKRHVMSQLFSDSSQPFYRFGETIFLQKIKRSEWVTFLIKEFNNSGKKIDEQVAGHLADLVQCHSYYIQYLARICWNNSQESITQKVLEESFEELLNDNLSLFQALVKGLTQYQVNYILALIARETKMTSEAVRTKYKIGSPGNIKRITEALQDMEILDYSSGKATFCEPFFEPLFNRYFIPIS